jgi:hypothetical protein
MPIHPRDAGIGCGLTASCWDKGAGVIQHAVWGGDLHGWGKPNSQDARRLVRIGETWAKAA